MSARPLLRVLPNPSDVVPDVRFCGYCGERPDHDDERRICGSCDLGMILSASAETAPRPDQASMIIDSSLTICALSRSAEVLLGVSEDDAMHRPLGALLSPAQAEGVGLDTLVSAVLSAGGQGSPQTQRAVVRPSGEWGIRYAVRIGTCGPPRAVLLVLDDDQV